MRLTVRTSILTAALLIGAICATVTAQNRKGYFPEDWVTYTQTRYVTSVAKGWDDIYFGTTHGIIRYNSLEEKWRDPMTASSGLPSDEIWRLAVNRDDDVIYAETSLGVYSYSPTFQEWTSEYDFPTELDDGNAMRQLSFEAYHFDLGYHLSYSSDNVYLTDPDLRDYQILDAAEDRWNHVWVATYGHGVADINLANNLVTMIPFGVFQEDVNVIYLDGSKVWFGGKQGLASENAITMWDRQNDTWQYFEARFNVWISSDEVNAIAGNGQAVYFGTDYGLVKYNRKSGTFRSFTLALGLRSNAVYSLFAEDSLLFVGGNGTIDVFMTPQDSIFPFTSSADGFGKILAMAHIGGDFWIGTEYGLHRLDGRTFKWGRFNIPSGHLGGAVWQIIEGTNGEIWFAGIDGVVHLDSNLTEIESFLTRTDLNEQMPHRIALAGDILWIGTDNGVFKYDRVRKTWKDYATYDGLIDNYVNDMVLENDHIWFATPRGATRFYWNNPLRVRED
ncbi:MAG: hypothetical protein ABIK83_08915 [Candidatus Zixiibacteriota bacterium]